MSVYVLNETYEERDLGVIMSNNLKWNKRCTIAAAKANMVLGQIKNSFMYLDHQTLKLLYTSLVRPHLEYAVSIWSSWYKTDIKILERIQKKSNEIG